MDKRICIGIPFSYHENWIGGTYYVTNLVHALKTLPDDQKPVIEVLCKNTTVFEWVKTETGYPYLNYVSIEPSFNIVERIINKLSRLLLKRNLISKYYSAKNADVIFPVVSGDDRLELVPLRKKIYWIPDFQERYYPQFFSKQENQVRAEHQSVLANSETHIIFSSMDAQQDMQKFFPSTKPSLYILRFAVTHPNYSELDINLLKQKYDINGHYFFSPNQFWQHKDQLTVLKAVALLKKQGFEISVAFTGKTSDYRNPDYYPSLTRFIQANSLEKNCLFLGFIDRAEQLQLMNHAIGVIQPSLFEGWSTVIEDAKAMNQFVIASDLPVNKEQLQKDGDFFPKGNAEALANLLMKYTTEKPERPILDYDESVREFGHSFMKIVNGILADP